MMRDLTRYLSMRLDRLPFESYAGRVTVLDIGQALQVVHPKVVHGALANVIPTEDIQPSRKKRISSVTNQRILSKKFKDEDDLLILVDEGRMVSAALGLHALWPQLVPVTVFKAIAVGFHGPHVQTLSHVD